MVKEGWEVGRFLWDPRPHLAGKQVVLLVEAWGLPAAEVGHKPSNQIVSESGAVDHLDEEVVRDRVKHLRDVHRYGYCSARGLALVETRDHPSRNGEQGQGGRLPWFEAVIGGGEYPVPPQWMGGGANPVSLLLGRAERLVSRSGPGLLASLPSKSGLWQSSSKLPGCQLRQLRSWRAPSGRSGRAH